jgi:outer membrane PBP1 activator LpoA protein
MARRLHASLLPALLAAVLLAGCGGSSSSSSSSSSSAATSSTPSTSSTASTGQTGSTATTPTSTSGSTSKSAAPASAIASCKHGVQSLPHLRQSTKERLEKICEKAASSDAVAKRKAAVEACKELVNASPLPAGKQRDRALAACKHAGG